MDYPITPHIQSESEYDKLYTESITDPEKFWARAATEYIDWSRRPPRAVAGSEWFPGGKLNVSFNCVDRWEAVDPDRTAIIYEGDSAEQPRTLTFKQLQEGVCRMANVLKRRGGVRKGDTVTIYMPTTPELVITMLACARIGAVHSVVFAGFSSVNLRERITDAASQVVICSDRTVRGGKIIPLRPTVNEAVSDCVAVHTVFVFPSGSSLSVDEFSNTGRFIDASLAMRAERPYCPPEEMDAEDPLFLLYTSGSTGRPKAILHTTGGYLVYAAMTHRLIFDVHPGDVWACVADCGWITGHSYVVYGPLCNGNSTFLFESVPTFPSPSRYWEMVDRHRITHLYTSPTAIRTLMKFGDSPVASTSRSSLRVLGSVGEPINPEAWRWLHSVVGGGRCPIIDTYWQTETGGILLAPLVCRTLKPGCATKPFFGIQPVIVDPITGHELTGADVNGLLALRGNWPGILRTIHGDHTRMEETYFNQFPGLYLTGDGAVRDSDGYYWLTGRVDDVIKVSGHRIGSAEIEHALVQHPDVSESAVVGFPHPIKGEGLFCYVTLKDGKGHDKSIEQLQTELSVVVRKGVGAVAQPDVIVVTPGLPKTRSGKIMRRILRKLANGQSDELGDVSTLADPSIVYELIGLVGKAIAKSQ
jgi:acetyl-CoA synthetase